ncbi:hypothetical protein [Mangrovibacterium lignilyticum]|uniref:hypothetical protein n=1 Tax=Mangrovibacterium lignilyticum TaxID=2668052 RepID=UPI0013CF6CFA|nr:hypothetical protein [Mangrovibacterium lignilyticum]
MKIVYLVLLVALFPLIGFAQEDSSTKSDFSYKIGDFFLGIGSGVDHNINAYRSEPTTDFSFEGIESRYNISFDASVMATKRWRPRIELQYHRLAYGQDWDGWQSVDYTTFEYTTTRVNYLGLNLHMDYLLLGLNSRFKVFVSPGLVTEYATGASYKTLKTDGDDSDSKFSVLGEYYPKCIAGASVQTIFKYDFSENIGFTVSPGYTRFFRTFTDASSDPYQRFNINLGLELRIH